MLNLIDYMTLKEFFMNVTIYTDGAARGNPGPGGYGAVLEYIDTKEIGRASCRERV